MWQNKLMIMCWARSVPRYTPCSDLQGLFEMTLYCEPAQVRTLVISPGLGGNTWTRLTAAGPPSWVCSAAWASSGSLPCGHCTVELWESLRTSRSHCSAWESRLWDAEAKNASDVELLKLLEHLHMHTVKELKSEHKIYSIFMQSQHKARRWVYTLGPGHTVLNLIRLSGIGEQTHVPHLLNVHKVSDLFSISDLRCWSQGDVTQTMATRMPL